jgi:hypothetical protein
MHQNFSGIWIADLLESAFVGPKPAGLQAKIEHCESELREELTVTIIGGIENRANFVCHTNGAEGSCFLNGQALRGRASWVGHELVIETWITIAEGETYFCDCWSLSPDGHSLVMEHRNDALTGQRVVFQRGASRHSSNIGTWR